jgi:hypothetical protein
VKKSQNHCTLLAIFSSKLFIGLLWIHIHGYEDRHSHDIHTSIHSNQPYSYSLGSGSITQAAVTVPTVVIMTITTFSTDDSIRVRREYICRRPRRRSRRSGSRRSGRSRCFGARSRGGCCAGRLNRRMRRRGRFRSRRRRGDGARSRRGDGARSRGWRGEVWGAGGRHW